MPRFARACGTSATSRRNRSSGSRRCSSPGAHQVHENVLERALFGAQVLEVDAELVELSQQARDAGAVRLRVEGVDEIVAVGGQLELPPRELRGHAFERVLQMQSELLAAELAHENALLFHQHD